MHAKAPTGYNFLSFHPSRTEFLTSMEHAILTNRIVLVFRISIYWRENDVMNLAPNIQKIALA